MMRIVVGIDGSDNSLTALELVTSTTWPAGTHIRLVGAYELPTRLTEIGPLLESGADERAQRRLFDTLATLAAPLEQSGYATEAVVARGRAADVLLAEADELAADLIVVGSRGLSVAASALVGSVSAALVDHASCPVLVARQSPVGRILLATDGSQSSEAIPAVLVAWNAFRNASIEVLNVAPPAGERRPSPAWHEVDLHRVMAEEMAARLRAGGWRATASVRNGEAARQIEEAAAEWGADLIITGSRGLGGLRRMLLGSVAHHVLLHSRSSVLVMRGHVPATQRVRLPATAGGVMPVDQVS